MAIFNRASTALVLVGLVLAGCSGDATEGIFATGSLANNPQTATAEPKVDPVCVSLVSRIDTLRREGIGDKIEKAAAKRYKMTQADLGKADQLNKASAEFQLRCSTITPRPTTAQLPPEASQPAATMPAKTAAKKTFTAVPAATP